MVPVRRSAGKKRVFELCGTAGGDLETPVIVSDKVVDNVAGVILIVIVRLMAGVHKSASSSRCEECFWW